MNNLKKQLKRSNESKNQIIQTNRDIYDQNKKLREENEEIKKKLQEKLSNSIVIEKTPTSDYQL